jgi:hypothetical protein
MIWRGELLVYFVTKMMHEKFWGSSCFFSRYFREKLVTYVAIEMNYVLPKPA